MSLKAKRTIKDLAIFGGDKIFPRPISTSNLVKPNFDRFLAYSREFYDANQYSNAGPMVRLLEARLADFHQTKHCVTFANGFWAIVLAIKALAIDGRTEVIMPSLTYRRLADIVAWANLSPRFCEVDADTLGVTAATVEACITDQTALILAAHPIVNCCDVEGITELGEARRIPVVFDAVESVYETVNGKRIGSFGNVECFSLHASKLINGFEGGYITTNDSALAARLHYMRGFGFNGPDNIIEFGTNSKLNEIHASMALACLDDLEDQVGRNRHRYYLYKSRLSDLQGIRLLSFDETEKTSYKTIIVEIEESWPLSRDETVMILNQEAALSRAYYAPPLHRKSMTYAHIPAVLELTDRLSEKFMLMPCGHFIEDEHIEAMCDLLAFIKANGSAIKELIGS